MATQDYFERNSYSGRNFTQGRGGKRGGRGGGFRGGRGGETHAPQTDGFSKPMPKTPAPQQSDVEVRKANVSGERGVPKPKHLSKTASPLTNDPLYDQAFVAFPGGALNEEPGFTWFRTSFAAMPALLDTVYRLTTGAKEFSRNVTPAMFRYYNAVLALGRIHTIRARNGSLLSDDERDLLRVLEAESFKTCAPIVSYLNGFGNFRAAGEKHFRWHMPALPAPVTAGGIPGFMGRVDVNTHVFYENIPVSGVFAATCCQEIVGVAQNWDLPAAIMPIAAGAIVPPGVAPVPAAADTHPSRACLGWAPTTRVRGEALAAYQACGIQPAAFPSSYGSIAVNLALMQHVSTHLERVTTFSLSSVSAMETGSLGQYIHSTISMDYVYLPNTNQVQTEYGTYTGHSSDQIPDTIGRAGTVFLYRFLREQIARGGVPGAEVNNWSCMQWNDFQDVPQAWQENRNSFLFPENIPEVLTLPGFRTGIFELSSSLDVILKGMVVKSA